MSSSVKTRKMTAGRGAEGKKGATNRGCSPKLTKYLQNLGVNKTPDTNVTDAEQKANAMPTPTRSSQNNDKGNDQVCEQLIQEESESENEIASINSEILMEDRFLRLPYENLGELEMECTDDIDPRSIPISTESIPLILLSLVRKIDIIETENETCLIENKELKSNLVTLEQKYLTQENESKKITTDLMRIKSAQNEVEKENNNLRGSLDFAYNKIAVLEENEKKRIEREKEAQQNMESIKGDNNKLKQDSYKMKEKNVKAETYSRRSNLRFEGIPTSLNETNVQCRHKVYEILKNELGLKDAEKEIVIERCHRDSKFPNQKPPSIIARFLSYRDREEVWENRRKVNQNRNNNLYINEDFPQEVEKKRSFLRPYMKEAYKHHMKATLVGDTLLVDGLKYTVDNLHTLPEQIRPEKTVVKTNGEVTVFFRKDAFMSNFFQAKMKIDETEYSCVEQFYMAKKAEKFSDKEAKMKIMSSNNPNEINFLGKNVKNFQQQKWNECAYDIMKKGVTEKFRQNQELADLLKNTGKTVIGEGSSKDLTWGTGVSVFHADAFDKAKWRGRNQLGKILMGIRDSINT